MSCDELCIHVQSLKENVARFRTKFQAHPSAEQFVILDDVLNSIPALVELAVQFDYKDVKGNGVRSIIRSCDRVCQTALTITPGEVDDFLFLMKHMSRGADLVLEGSEDILNDNFDSEFNRKAVVEACSFGEEVLKRSLSYRYFASNCPALRPVLMPLFMFSSFMYSLSFGKAVSSLFSLNASAANYAHSVDKISASQMSQFVRAVNMPITRICTRIIRLIVDRGAMYDTRSCCVTVTSSFEIVMGDTDVRLERRLTPITNKISFSTLRRGTSDKYKNKVLMFVHGGAFFGPTASSLEDLYVKDFCKPCPGLTVVNVDYPCAPEHRFPTALQCLLDLYVWLVSKSDSVKKLLGFHPEELVLSGDSCGGNMAGALLLILNDLRLKGLADIRPMPRSLALFFPKLSIRLELQPSMCLAMMDPLINLFVLLRVGQAYAPATRRGSDGIAYLTNDVPHDYVQRQDEYDLFSTPYTSLHLYEHLDSLSHVHLNIMALHFDPLLDESIRLAKKWKGPVDLRVVDDTCHGALIFRVLYPSVGSELLDNTVSLIQKSFSDVDQ